MTREEIALQLTLASIGNIALTKKRNLSEGAKPENAEFNQALAKEISDFYNCIFEKIKVPVNK